MINARKLDINYLQKGNTCVLSSYSIVNNYYTRNSIENVFSGYCKHFNLNNKTNMTIRYDNHFHLYIQNLNIPGYKCIIDLHNNSMQNCFVNGRSTFDVLYYDNTMAHLNEIENILFKEEAFLNLCFSHINGFHSITIYCDNIDSNFKIRDTENKLNIVKQNLIELVNELISSLNYTICDSVLYSKLATI